MSALCYLMYKKRDEMQKKQLGDKDVPHLEEENFCDLRFHIGREECLEDAFKERMLLMQVKSDLNYRHL